VRSVKVKICGMRDPQNIDDVARLGPDYLGFIFSPASPRFVGTRLNTMQMRHFDSAIRKVGVFVDQPVDEIVRQKDAYFLNMIQLHGGESPEFCRELRAAVPGIEIIKAFAVHAGFDLASSAPYEPYCALFLFDTQSAVPGGSGASFDWSLLTGYRGQLDYLLSGGVGRSNFKQALAWVRGHERAAGLDLNSRIETAPGVKSLALAGELLREAKS